MATPTNLPASFSTGAVLTAAQMNDLRGAFRILRVYNNTTTTGASSSSSTFVDTGLSITLTPTSSTSTFLLFASVNGGKVAAITTGIQLRLVRGASAIGSSFSIFHGYGTSSTDNNFAAGSISYLDSPATASSTTYKVQFARSSTGTGTVEVQNNSTMSSLTVMEISA